MKIPSFDSNCRLKMSACSTSAWDVIKWNNFPRYWSFVRGIHRSPVNSPHKGQWRGALMFYLISAWINGWVNNHEAGDLRRHYAHYDVTVMWYFPAKRNKSMWLFHRVYAKKLLVSNDHVQFKIRFSHVSWWRHDMKTLSALLTLYEGCQWIPISLMQSFEASLVDLDKLFNKLLRCRGFDITNVTTAMDWQLQMHASWRV